MSVPDLPKFSLSELLINICLLFIEFSPFFFALPISLSFVLILSYYLNYISSFYPSSNFAGKGMEAGVGVQFAAYKLTLSRYG